MNRLMNLACVAGVACVLVCMPPRASAQADVLGVLDVVEVSSHETNTTAVIKFNVPIHYVRHFPAGEGDVVQITVQAVSVAAQEEDQAQRRESLTWTPSREFPLTDVSYEGDSTSGPNLVVRFRHPVKYTVEEGKDSRSIIVTVARPPAPPETPTAAPAVRVPSAPMLEPVTDAKAGEWMTQGRQAMTANDYPQAVRVFTKVLQHPGHKYLPEAKELLGLARERNKQLAHARAEYEEYLTLYPQGEGAGRVRQRLDALLTAGEPGKEKLRAAKGGGQKAAGAMTVNGSVSQYYRRDVNSTDQTGAIITQSSLTNYLDLGTRWRGERYDMRSQFTGSYIHDFLRNVSSGGSTSGARVSSLYVDANDRQHLLSAKVGRQTRSSGGVLGRFDGGLFGFGVTPKWKINAVAGAPVELSADNGVQTDRLVYGASLDGGTFADHWDTSFFAIQQTVDSIVDRQAVGTEVRYITPQASIFTLADYDISYSLLNTVLALANWQFEGGAGLSLTLDYRLSPILTTSNALQGQTTATSIKEMLAIMSESEVRQLAVDRTARSKSATVGGNVPINEKLQVSGDVTLSNLGSMPASTAGTPVDAVEGTGNEFIYSAQLIGSNLLKEGDSTIFGVRYYDAKDSKTSSLILNSRYPVNSDWRINPRLRIDYKTSATSGDTISYLPQLRTDYRLRKELTFELEGGLEWDDQRGIATAQDSQGYYFSLGYRWNF